MRHKILVIDNEGVTPIVAHVVPLEGDEVRHGWGPQHSAECRLVVGRRSASLPTGRALGRGSVSLRFMT